VVVAAGSRDNGPGPLIYVFAATGRVLESHPVPTDRPTACAFGGEGLATLFVTTEDGHLFQVRNTGRVGYSAR